MATLELKRCPFCGGEAEEFTEQDSRIEPLVPGHPIDVFVDNTYFGVRCKRCDVGQTNPFVKRVDAVVAWNRRTSPDAINALVEAADRFRWLFIADGGDPSALLMHIEDPQAFTEAFAGLSAALSAFDGGRS